jgi:hypothetical protein
MRTQLAIIGSLLVAALVVSACGENPKPTSTVQPNATSTTSIASAATPTPTTPPLATTAASQNQSVTVSAASECYLEAVNARNLDKLTACFAPDALIIDVTRQITGQTAIRTWAQNEVIGGSLQVVRNEASANRDRMLVHWAPAGSNGWRAYYTFDYVDGRITRADLQYAIGADANN